MNEHVLFVVLDGHDQIQVSLQTGPGRLKIAIRRYYTAKDGSLRPSREGITLPPAISRDLCAELKTRGLA